MLGVLVSPNFQAVSKMTQKGLENSEPALVKVNKKL